MTKWNNPRRVRIMIDEFDLTGANFPTMLVSGENRFAYNTVLAYCKKVLSEENYKKKSC